MGVLRLVERLLLRGLVRRRSRARSARNAGNRSTVSTPLAARSASSFRSNGFATWPDEARERRAVAPGRRGRALREDLHLGRDGHEQEVDAVLGEQVAGSGRSPGSGSCFRAACRDRPPARRRATARRTETRRCPASAFAPAGTAPSRRLSARVQRRDLLRPGGPRAAVRRELRAHRPRDRRRCQAWERCAEAWAPSFAAADDAAAAPGAASLVDERRRCRRPCRRACRASPPSARASADRRLRLRMSASVSGRGPAPARVDEIGVVRGVPVRGELMRPAGDLGRA